MNRMGKTCVTYSRKRGRNGPKLNSQPEITFSDESDEEEEQLAPFYGNVGSIGEKLNEVINGDVRGNISSHIETPSELSLGSGFVQTFPNESNNIETKYFKEPPPEKRLQWSPGNTPKSSPKRKRELREIASPDSPARLRAPPTLSKSPRLSKIMPSRKLDPQSSANTSAEHDVWSLLEEASNEPSPKKKRTFEILRNLSDEHSETEEDLQDLPIDFKDIMANFTEQNNINEPMEDVKIAQVSPRRAVYPVKQSKTYGIERSYLLEKESDHSDTNDTDDGPGIEDYSTEIKEEEGNIRNIYDLRASGASNRISEELNYLLDGIEVDNISVQLHSLLELVVKLSDADFLHYMKAIDFPEVLINLSISPDLRINSLLAMLFYRIDAIPTGVDVGTFLSTLLEKKERLEDLSQESSSSDVWNIIINDLIVEFTGSKPRNKNSTTFITTPFVALLLIWQMTLKNDPRISSSFKDPKIVQGVNESISDIFDEISNGIFSIKRQSICLSIYEHILSDEELGVGLESDIYCSNLRYICSMIEFSNPKKQSMLNQQVISSSLRILILLSTNNEDQPGSEMFEIINRPKVIIPLLKLVDRSLSNEIDSCIGLFGLGYLINLIDTISLCHKRFYEDDVLKEIKGLFNSISEKEQAETFRVYVYLIIGLLRVNGVNKETDMFDNWFSQTELEAVKKELVEFNSKVSQELGGIKVRILEVLKHI